VRFTGLVLDASSAASDSEPAGEDSRSSFLRLVLALRAASRVFGETGMCIVRRLQSCNRGSLERVPVDTFGRTKQTARVSAGTE
jgi:hypothetical protein